jgi:hypothetical protein
MCHVYNKGGRKAAGYKGDAGDCVARVIAIASGLPHKQVSKGQAWAHSASQSGRNATSKSLPPGTASRSVESRLMGFFGRGRPGPAAILARNVHLNDCIYEFLVNFGKVCALIRSKLDT